MNKKEKEAGQRDAVAQLHTYIKPGDTIYTILRHCSSSGMTRVIDLKIIGQDTPRIYNIGFNTAIALGLKWDYKNEGIRISGVGMDMGFNLVYSLSRTLFNQKSPGNTFLCLGEGCPSNDHANGEPIEIGRTHSDGGYALRHAWL